MSSRPALGYWLLFIVINVAISALTSWFVVRQLIPSSPAVTPRSAALSTPTVTPASIATTTDATGNGGLAVPANSEAVATAVPPASAPTTSVETPTGAPPSAPVGDIRVRITAVIYPGQPSREVVVIDNESSDINLSNWTIVSPRGKVFTFGNLTLYKDSFINIHTMTGTNTPTDLFWNQTESIWQSGDQVQIKQGDNTMATYTVK